MGKRNKLKKRFWFEPNGPELIRSDLVEHGVAWFSYPGAAELVQKNHSSFAQKVLGPNINKCFFNTVAKDPNSKHHSYLVSNKRALLHTDVSPDFQNDIQLMVCKQNAPKGGESLFVDLWSVLDRIRKRDPELYYLLFTDTRPFFTSRGPFWSRTVSWKKDRLVCAHVPGIAEFDIIGNKFQEWIDNEPVTQFKLEKDDCYVLNNHRMVHGRTEFSGTKRLLYRTDVVLKKPIQTLCRHKETAQFVDASLDKLRLKFR